MKTKQNKKVGYARKMLLFVILPLILLLGVGVVALTLTTRSPAKRESLYLTMPDGTKIAADVWLPADLKPGQKVPTILRSVRYWRGYQPGPMASIFRLLGQGDLDAENIQWAEAGYAFVTIDVRGSGASFGQWYILWSSEETADLGEVVDWIVAQSWSNGRVGAYGVSYDGNTAEMTAALNHPAVKAVVPQYGDFDVYTYLVRPGGVYNQWLLESWHEFTQRLDANDVCILAEAVGATCDNIKSVITGVRLVDNDPDGTQLATAIASREEVDLVQVGQSIEYYDDEWGSTGKTYGDVSPYSARTAIEDSGVPMYVWVSCLDSATVDGALSRYLTFRNRQKLIIGPWNHGGGEHADPFLPPDTPTDPSPEQQFQMVVDFFDVYLKDEPAPEPTWDITYYTLGEGTWQTTQTWPPAGFSPERWYFGPDGSLTAEVPATEAGVDEYTVDWTATTGELTRWHTALVKADVVYPDRAEEDKKLLTYTSPPLETDIEITGSPIVTLYVASTEDDGAFHVYLEDVAPDGRVTYLTEGGLRAVHRQVSEKEPPYLVQGPYHSFERADAALLVPGEVTEISLNLYATSILIKEGHRLRVAVAGHDASVFARYPAEGTPVLTVQRNSLYPSYIELPMMAREY
jgi:putative CocE/NonD family hydrolase